MKYLLIILLFYSCVPTKQITKFGDLQGNIIPHEIIVTLSDSYQNANDGYSFIYICYEYTGEKKKYIENKLKIYEEKQQELENSLYIVPNKKY